MNVVELKTKSEDVILDKLKELVECASHTHYTGIACVLIAANGGAFIVTKGNGNRLELLGAVTDLQHQLCTDGDDI